MPPEERKRTDDYCLPVGHHQRLTWRAHVELITIPPSHSRRYHLVSAVSPYSLGPVQNRKNTYYDMYYTLKALGSVVFVSYSSRSSPDQIRREAHRDKSPLAYCGVGRIWLTRGECTGYQVDVDWINEQATLLRH